MPVEQECCDEENIVRAITSVHYDDEKDKISSSVFKGRNISVSRLKILSIEDIFYIFKEELSSPEKPLVYAGEINIGNLKRICEQHKDANGKELPLYITVLPAPTNSNPAHAEIPQKISRGIAKKIIENLKLHDV